MGSKNERTGAQVAIDVLIEQGVKNIFGHTGGAVIPLHVELNYELYQVYKFNNLKLTFMLVSSPDRR